MPCDSIGGAWDNDLHYFGVSSIFQNRTSSRFLNSQRSSSTGVSFSSDSDCSMAQDTESTFDFGDLFETPGSIEEQEPESFIFSTQVTPSVSPTNMAMNSYDACADAPMTSYAQASSSSYSPVPYSSYPQNTYNHPQCTTYANMDVNTPQQHMAQVQSPMMHSPQCSPTTSTSDFTEKCPKSATYQNSQSCQENEIELSDDEESNDVVCQRRDFQNHCRTTSPSSHYPMSPNPWNERIPSHNFNHQTHTFQYSGAHPNGSLQCRPRSGKQPILSHFLYHALENPKHYNTMIKWVNREEGVFEFQSKHKESLARAWGKVKNNRRCMTYPKMARALRKYIENGIVLKKLKNRLRYEFLPDFLHDLRSGNEPRQLSEQTIQQMFLYSRSNGSR